jgi:hypothetical protein
MTRTDRIGQILEQQVQSLPSTQVEPQHDEVERLRLGNFAQSQEIAVEMSTSFHTRNNNGDMVNLRKLKHDGSSCFLVFSSSFFQLDVAGNNLGRDSSL